MALVVGEKDGGPIASHLPGTTLGVVKLPSLLPNGSVGRRRLNP
jgi:hypothetical protein